MIEIKNLFFSFGKHKIFDNLCLKIEDGERIVLSGPSGVGKTTLLRLILGLEKAKKGSVNTFGAKISAVFQEDRLLPFKTVMENLTLFSNEEAAKECLQTLGIADAANLYPAELSGGMARRVALARAMSVEADIYILDEAFTGLDEENKKIAARFINRKTAGKILIAVSHDSEDATLLDAEILDISGLVC